MLYGNVGTNKQLLTGLWIWKAMSVNFPCTLLAVTWRTGSEP